MRIVRTFTILLAGLSMALACGFDGTLRAYLDVHFWLPFAKSAKNFEKPNVKRVSMAYAGMGETDRTPLGTLRAAYQARRVFAPILAPARADRALTRRDREEVELIDAKSDMRAGEDGDAALLRSAQEKLERFLQSARTPEWLSEARGWLAHIHYVKGEQSAAGRIYLDELNREGSNLSRETLLNSLRMNYGYTGGQDLLDHLEEYFDTPEHAAFAIQLATNPQGPTRHRREVYARLDALLQKHAAILRSPTLALLTMRIALSMGDPAQALKIAARAGDSSDPDYLWMLAAAHFVSRDYAGAEAPLLRLFAVGKEEQKAAAAYGLCGVYQKTGNPVEQLRFALWLSPSDGVRIAPIDWSGLSVYWALSGFDVNLLLDSEAPTEALTELLTSYPEIRNARLVRYALAVRLSRENRYDEAAEIYEAIGQKRRGPRMRELAALWTDQSPEGKFAFAEYVGNHSVGIYFNDSLWGGYQRYALIADSDSRLTGEERVRYVAGERKLRDDQEELWRAHLVLREVMTEAGHTELGMRAAKLAQRDLRKLSQRFGRQDEIRAADMEVTRWLRAR